MEKENTRKWVDKSCRFISFIKKSLRVFVGIEEEVIVRKRIK